MRSLGIVFLCIFAAIGYGILHNQITARVCVEYFTIGHPPIFRTDNPTLLAIGWGILATWWVGVLLGIPLAIAARADSRPKRAAWTLVRPIVQLQLVMAGCAILAGITGWLLSGFGMVWLVGPIAKQLSADRHAVFLADLWAHSMSYLMGFIGGCVVIINVWRSRSAIEEPTIDIVGSP